MIINSWSEESQHWGNHWAHLDSSSCFPVSYKEWSFLEAHCPSFGSPLHLPSLGLFCAVSSTLLLSSDLGLSRGCCFCSSGPTVRGFAAPSLPLPSSLRNWPARIGLPADLSVGGKLLPCRHAATVRSLTTSWRLSRLPLGGHFPALTVTERCWRQCPWISLHKMFQCLWSGVHDILRFARSKFRQCCLSRTKLAVPQLQLI